MIGDAAGTLTQTKFDHFGQREDPSGLAFDVNGKLLVSGTRTTKRNGTGFD